MIKDDAFKIIYNSIYDNKPEPAIKQHLKGFSFHNGKLIVIAVGKASFLMAKAAKEVFKKKIDSGIVITKQGHADGEIEGFEIYEGSHPVLKQSTIDATERVLEVTKDLSENDDVIFLLSGGGSALFEKPICSLAYLQNITEKLLKSGADIKEINTIRKCLSSVKGGKFAKWCAPAHVSNFILSDVISNELSMIASGPTVEDHSQLDPLRINQKYQLGIEEGYLKTEKVSSLDNVNSTIIGSVTKLVESAKRKAESLGYSSEIVSDSIEMNDQDFAKLLIQKAKQHQNTDRSLAFIYGGETTVVVKGDGLGGRNQQIALSCIKDLKDCCSTAIFSIGSDGTDGPTDAAGGYVDTTTYLKASELSIDIEQYLDNNDSYHALTALDCLVVTGPTNTNVNDLSVVLIKRDFLSVDQYQNMALDIIKEEYPFATKECFSGNYTISNINDQWCFTKNACSWEYPGQWYPNSLYINTEQFIALLVEDGIKGIESNYTRKFDARNPDFK